MNIHHYIEETIGEDSGVLLADGFEDAFIGVGWQANLPVAVYDRDECINILMKDGMEEDEAEEYFEFNVQGAYVGLQTPMFLVQ